MENGASEDLYLARFDCSDQTIAVMSWAARAHSGEVVDTANVATAKQEKVPLIPGSITANVSKFVCTGTAPPDAGPAAAQRDRLQAGSRFEEVFSRNSEAQKAAQPVPQTAAIRSINQVVFANEDDANAFRERLRAGVSFVDAAPLAGYSPADTEVGNVTKAKLAEWASEAVADAAFSVALPSVTAPVKSDFGWHVLQVAKPTESQDRP